MKTRRIILITAVVLIMVFATIPVLAQEEEEEEGPVEITMWTWFDDFRDVFPQVVEDFNESQDDIRVEQEIYSLDEYLQILQSSVAAEEEPDIFGPHTQVRGFGEEDVVIDFYEYMDDEFIDRFSDGTIQQYTWNDKLYALPWTAQTFGVFYNKEIFETYDLEIPETWSEMVEVATKLREDAPMIQPIAFGNSGQWMGADFFLPLITQTTDDPSLVIELDRRMDDSRDVSWNSEPVVEAFEIVETLVNEEVFAPGANGLSDDQATNMFYNGRAAMYFAGSWMPQTFALEAPEDLDWGVFKTPANGEGNRHWTGNESGANLSVSARSDNIDEALEFLEYLYSPEVYSQAMVDAKGMPAMKEVVDKIEDPAVRKMTSWLEDGAPHILYGEGSWDAVANAVQGVVGGEMSPEEAAEQIEEDVQKAKSR